MLILKVTAKSLQSCLTLCDPIDGSPPGFPRPKGAPSKGFWGPHQRVQMNLIREDSGRGDLCDPGLPRPKMPVRRCKTHLSGSVLP